MKKSLYKEQLEGNELKELVVLPTNYCNFNCQHCGIKKSNEKNYISIVKMKKILKFFREKKFTSLAISGGGEPTTNIKKLIKIIEIGKEYGFKIRLVTNASFMLKKDGVKTIKRLKKAGLDRISISTDEFHSKFISARLVVKAIKSALRVGINTGIGIVNTEDVAEKNLEILKEIAKELNGKLTKIFPIKIRTGVGYITRYLILLKDKTVWVKIFDAQKTNTNDKINFKKMILKRFLFMRCLFNPFYRNVINLEGDILPCCGFNAANNPRLYRIGNIDMIKDEDDISLHNPILKLIQLDKFGFLKLYLRAEKNKRLKILLNKRYYYSICDLCEVILKHRKKFLNMPEPSSAEIIFFALRNLDCFVTEIVRRILFTAFIYISFIKYTKYR